MKKKIIKKIIKKFIIKINEKINNKKIYLNLIFNNKL